MSLLRVALLRAALVVAALTAAAPVHADLVLPGARPPPKLTMRWVTSTTGSVPPLDLESAVAPPPGVVREDYSAWAGRVWIDVVGDTAIARRRPWNFRGALAQEERRALTPDLDEHRVVELPPRAAGAPRGPFIHVLVRDEARRGSLVVRGELPEVPTSPLRELLALRDRLRAGASYAPVTLAPSLQSGAVGAVRVVDGATVEVLFRADDLEPGPSTAGALVEPGVLEVFDANGTLGTLEVRALTPSCAASLLAWRGSAAALGSLRRPLRPTDLLDGVAAFVRRARDDTRGPPPAMPAGASSMKGDVEGDGKAEALVYVDEQGAPVLRTPRGDAVLVRCPSP